MTTLGVMQDRIELEIDDTTIRAQVTDAILTAIREYQFERFWFNEDRTLVFTTSASQEFYSTLATPPTGVAMNSILMIDAVKVNVSGSRLLLTRRDWNTLEYWSVTTSSTGTPSDYTYYDEEIRLYPIPNASLTVQIAALIRLPTLSATTDSNAWMTDGEPLIRARAKFHLYANVKRETAEALKFATLAEDEIRRLRRETIRRLSSRRVVPWTL